MGGQRVQRRAGRRRPPGEVPARESLEAPSNRQNTTKKVQPGGHVTITDPSHPLYGQTFSVLRVYSPRAKNGLVVALPDGRARRIPRTITDLVEPPNHHAITSVISAPALLPLARLICAMVATPEVATHDNEQNNNGQLNPVHPLSSQLASSPAAADASLRTQSASSTPTHTVFRRTDRPRQKSLPRPRKERVR